MEETVVTLVAEQGQTMEVLTAIATAISVGAAEGLKSSASKAVLEAYERLKNYLVGHYKSIDLAKVQERPDSSARKAVLVEDLHENGAAEDKQLLDYASALLESASSAATSDAIVIREARAARNIILRKISATGRGVVAESLDAGGDISITDIDAGVQRLSLSKKAGGQRER